MTPAPSRRIGDPLHRREEVASTMDAVRELSGDGAAVVADRQTAGRGRRGRTWHSPEGGLHLSFRLEPGVPPAEVALVPLWVGVAVARTLERLDLEPRLSWPNDVVLDARKVGGILSESRIVGGRVEEVVVGVGLNVANDPPDGVPAASLARELGRPVAVDDVLDPLLEELTRAYRAFRDEPAGFLPGYTDRCRTLGRAVCVETETGDVEGEAVGIGPRGELRVRTGDGTRSLAWGDVETVEVPA